LVSLLPPRPHLLTYFPLIFHPTEDTRLSWPVQVQLLSDNQRGATLEAVVSRMKTIHSLNSASLDLRQTSSSSSADSGPSGIRFIAVSATIPNVSDVRRSSDAPNYQPLSYFQPNSTWLVASRHDSKRSTCRARRVERVEPWCSTSSTQPPCMGSRRRTCRIVSRRDVMSQVEFGL